MNDQSLLRYSRHLLLTEWSEDVQARLARSRVLVVGMGGLGCTATQFLASAGVGELIISDDDTVELSNLQRQVLHDISSLGLPKVESAQKRLTAINPEVSITPLALRMDGQKLGHWIGQVDLVLDCSDNFATRLAVNAACVAAKVPLVVGTAVQFQGQLLVIDPRLEGSPCYHCLFPSGSTLGDQPCATMGVFAPLVGVVGCLQASCALKLLGGLSGQDVGVLSLWNLAQNISHRINVPPDLRCPVCSVKRNGTYLSRFMFEPRA
ncbi:MAG: HesA/MoeB/ThiF family protein [Burkholderiaceae bacterium]|nr:HesA/MoeB/ThiF family protein [Burkholderiaceae bacterium]MDH3459732.1 HesA/MoeB/ThiF family protein [Burkholderiaceae bacterium]